MITTRIQKVIKKLHNKGYRFDSNLIENSVDDKFIGEITIDEKSFLLYLVLNEKSDKVVNLVKEAKVLRLLENLDFTPKIIEFSEKDLYIIRENISGEISGNVYCFNQKNLADNEFINDLVKKVENIWSTKISSFVPMLNLNSIFNKLEGIKTNQKEFEVLAEKISNQFKKNNNLILGDSIVFLHGDLQPTNILIDKNKVKLIDFESVSGGSIYYDFANLYHRLYGNETSRTKFLQLVLNFFDKNNFAFNQALFNLFYAYYLLIDATSLDWVYIKKTSRSFHHTEIDATIAKDLKNDFLNKLNKLSF